MKICSICKRISASDEDHIHCVEKRRIELESEDFKESIPERLTISGTNDLSSDIKGVLDHLSREKKKSQ